METFGRYSGIADITDAQRLALDLTNYKPPLLVETTDNGTWKWLGGTAWAQTHSGGAARVSDAALDYIPYSDATYDYYCEAAPGTALATAAWRIVRKNRSTGYWQYADGGAFANAATDLATVQGAFA